MKRWTRIALIAASVGALVLTAAGAGASAAPTTSPAPNRPDVVAAPAVIKPLTNAANVVVQTQYVPITPCRIADTRGATSGAKLVSGVVRTFLVSGLTTDLSGQGGNINGCGIPFGATAIAASMTATQATGNGFLRAWAVGTPQPTATVLNYVNTGNGGVTVGAPLPIKITTTPSTQLAVIAYGARTHLVIDVLGYYIEPIAGTISSNGILGSSSNQVVSSARGGGNPTGVYVVTFNQTVTGCVLQVTPNTTGYVLVTGILNGTTATIVGRAPGSGALADTPVAFTVTC